MKTAFFCISVTSYTADLTHCYEQFFFLAAIHSRSIAITEYEYVKVCTLIVDISKKPLVNGG